MLLMLAVRRLPDLLPNEKLQKYFIDRYSVVVQSIMRFKGLQKDKLSVLAELPENKYI